MALKVVNTESLDAVANAINAKSGTSGALQFPDGFVNAIQTMSGGGEDLSTVLAEQEELVAELKSVIATKAKLGDAKLPSILDGTVTELTAEDLAGVTSLRRYAFYNTRVVNVELPTGIVSIGDSVFDNCAKLVNITLPNGITSIGGRAFYGCNSLANIVLPDSVTSIGNYLCYNCGNLASVIMPNGLKNISDYAFQACSKMTSVTLPNELTYIGRSSFEECKALTSITLPDTVTTLGALAFKSCNNLEYIDLTAYGTDGEFPSLVNTNAFQSVGTSTASGTFQIRVKANGGANKARLAGMTNWSSFASKIVEV